MSEKNHVVSFETYLMDLPFTVDLENPLLMTAIKMSYIGYLKDAKDILTKEIENIQVNQKHFEERWGEP